MAKFYFTQSDYILRRQFRREYDIWVEMNHRCRNPRHSDWKYYGGRGIFVCHRWQKSFRNFLTDLGPRPSEKYTLDRKNNERGYAPSNCRWRTRKEQMRNMRGNRLLTHKGKTLCISAWAERIGIDKQIIYDRLHWGWSVERALTTPVNAHQKLLTFEGKTQTICQWAREKGVSMNAVYSRLKMGCPPEIVFAKNKWVVKTPDGYEVRLRSDRSRLED